MRGAIDNESCSAASVMERGRLLKDADIRVILTRWLDDQYQDDPSTVFYEELAIPRPTSRADVAVVNGAFVGYEIKSDVDTTTRLPSQVKSYSHVFDRIYLVTTKNRKAHFSAFIPAWWGVIRVDEDGSVKKIRAAKLNKKVNCVSVLYLLTVNELRHISKILGMNAPRSLKKSQLIEEMSSKYKKSQVLYCVRESLKKRKLDIQNSSSKSSA